MINARLLAAIPLVLAGKSLIELGYRLIGGTAPHRRR